MKSPGLSSVLATYWRWLKLALFVGGGIVLLVILLTLTACTAAPRPTSTPPAPTATHAPDVTLTPTPAPSGYPRVSYLYTGEQTNVNGVAVVNVSVTICRRMYEVTLEVSPGEREDASLGAAWLDLCYAGMGV